MRRFPTLPRTVREWHSLVGMFFSIILLYLFVSGTASVFSPEIDWIVNPAHRAVPTEQGKLSLGSSYEAARAARPGWDVTSVQRMPGARFADQILILNPEDGARGLVLVDPYRAAVNDVGRASSVRMLLREFHRGLSSRSRYVQIAVALMALPLAAILVTSLLLYRRFYRGLFLLPRRGARRRAFLSDLHRLVGAWSVLFLVPVVVTSAWFLAELLGLGPAFYADNRLPETPATALPVAFSGAELDRAVAMAGGIFPGLAVTTVELPAMPGMPLVVRGDLDGWLARPNANSVYLDPAGLGIVAAHRAEELGAGLRIFEAMRVMHYGTFAGLPSRLLWLLFGIGLSALAALGAMIHAERLVFMSHRSETIPPRSRLGHYWAGMGWGKWLGLAMIAFAVARTARALL